MNTKNLFFALLASMTALTATAQETYQDTKLIGNDLNGTARYVGMVALWRRWVPTSRR